MWVQVILSPLASRPEGCLWFGLVSDTNRAFVNISMFGISGITSFLGEFMFCLTWLFCNCHSTASLLHTCFWKFLRLLPVTVHPHLSASIGTHSCTETAWHVGVPNHLCLVFITDPESSIYYWRPVSLWRFEPQSVCVYGPMGFSTSGT